MVKVGLIGVGTVAQLMHLPILSDLKEHYRIAAVSDVSPSQLAYIADKYNATPYPSPFDLVRDPEVEAVFVLSPDQYHFEYAKAALEAGKHVFVEKPVTLCPQELEELIALEKVHPEQICMVGYMRRYAQGFLKCKELLEADDRKIEYMRFRDIILEGDFYIGQTKLPFLPSDVSRDLIEESGKRRREQIGRALGEDCTEQQRTTYQMLTGLGCHTLAAVRELVGMPKKVESVAVDGEHVIAVLRYDDFLALYEIVNDQDVVQFDASIEIYQHDRRMHIKHETPYLRYQPHTFEVVESTKTDTKTTLYGPDYRDSFENEVKYYHDCIVSGVQPKTDFADAMDDFTLFKQICDKIEE
ncbi:Gfo/Idh/MocA family protein [Butyricicoccus sp. Marseille-Q5471]|uniref:Gfo/Idh/MocA family protein n=1 Tax=Butyricicoccus sp. Marseille-Q5471 TaxID=3039493 RepID=UPI0024BC3135|nr:Gfo/Idh/MocA family oxidoreductase [Butyricicoccus sp. Marseille-Q5471]